MTTAAAAPLPPANSRRGRNRAAAPAMTTEEEVQSKRSAATAITATAVLIEEENVAPGTPPKKSRSGGGGRGEGKKRTKGRRGKAASASASVTEETASTSNTFEERAIGAETASNIPNVVTPNVVLPEDDKSVETEKGRGGEGNGAAARARRSLSSAVQAAAKAAVTTKNSSSQNYEIETVPSLVSSSSSESQSSSDEDEGADDEEVTESAAAPVQVGTAKRHPFGHATASQIKVLPSVRRAYSRISARTGSLGGNAHGGAIYGELTVGSMQKMVDLMKIHTEFGPDSRFIDVGCGLGKPNVHVALDPGVEFSYGCEMEAVRWWLGMSNVDSVLQGMKKGDCSGGSGLDGKFSCILAHADATEAKTFDPFTHVYMFDIGFPPALFHQLAKMYNSSTTPRYLICYHAPRLMVERYGFDVELITQAPTSMHGSAEGHTGYVYRRTNLPKTAVPSGGISKKDDSDAVPCDPLFRSAYDLVRTMSRPEMTAHVRKVVEDNFAQKNVTDGVEGGSCMDGGLRRSRRLREKTAN